MNKMSPKDIFTLVVSLNCEFISYLYLTPLPPFCSIFTYVDPDPLIKNVQ